MEEEKRDLGGRAVGTDKGKFEKDLHGGFFDVGPFYLIRESDEVLESWFQSLSRWILQVQ